MFVICSTACLLNCVLDKKKAYIITVICNITPVCEPMIHNITIARRIDVFHDVSSPPRLRQGRPCSRCRHDIFIPELFPLTVVWRTQRLHWCTSAIMSMLVHVQLTEFLSRLIFVIFGRWCTAGNLQQKNIIPPCNLCMCVCS